MILRRSGNRSVPVSRQSQYSRRILSVVKEQDAFCVIKETYREILKDYMDLENSIQVLRKLEKSEFKYEIAPLSDIPSPFAHGIVLLGVADIVQISDRSALLRELHQQVLAKVFGREGTKEILFSKDLVTRIFNNRSYKNEDLPISSLKQLRNAVKALSPIRIIGSISPSIYHHSISDQKQIRTWSLALINNKEFLDIYITKGDRRAIPVGDYQIFWNIYAKSNEKTKLDEKILKLLNQKSPLSIKEISEQLNEVSTSIEKRLEELAKAMLITRIDFEIYGGKERWKHCLVKDIIPEYLRKQSKRLDPEECLKKLVKQYLKVHGPSTNLQINEYLKLDVEKITRALTELEQTSEILKGQIVESSIEPQYIRLDDRELLRNLSNRKPDSLVLTPEEMNFVHYYFSVEHYLSQELKGKESVIEVLDSFGSIEDLSSLATRILDFDKAWVRELIEKNELIQGRFSHNRLAYVSRTMFPYYFSAYREPIKLSQVEDKIISTIRKYGPLTKREIKEFTELEDDIIQESLMILDKTLYLVRKSVTTDSFLPRRFIPNVYDVSTRYLQIDKLPSYEESQKYILLKLVESMGPVSLVELTQILGFKYSDIERIIKELLQTKKIIEKKLTERETNYYMSPNRFKEISRIKDSLIYSAFREEEKIIILPRADPFTKLGLRIHLRDIYGEGHIDPILLDGRVIGSIEYKLHKGQYLQIYNLRLDNEVIYHPILLQKIAAELVRYTRRILRVLSLQIEDINSRSVLSKANKIISDTLVKTGYKLIKDTLVGGDTVTRIFSRRIVDKYLMEQLWIRREIPVVNADSLLALVNHFGHVSFNEVKARFPETVLTVLSYLINQLLEEKKIICQGDVLYSLSFARYRKSGLLRRKKVNPEMEDVYNHIHKGFTNITELANRWKKSPVAFKSAITSLEAGMLIGTKSISNQFKPQEYYDIKTFIPRYEEEISIIRKRYIKDLVSNLGIATESQISERGVIPGVLSRVRVKEILSILLDEEVLLGGRFVENDLRFYYMTKENHDDLVMTERKEEEKVDYVTKEELKRFYILHPSDVANIILRDQYPERFDVSFDNYTVLLNQRLAAQCKVDSSVEKRTKIKNLNLSPWIQSESSFNYVINAVENIPMFNSGETESIIIEKVNGLPVQSLVI